MDSKEGRRDSGVVKHHGRERKRCIPKKKGTGGGSGVQNNEETLETWMTC
jgi:hypothetical protein